MKPEAKKLLDQQLPLIRRAAVDLLKAGRSRSETVKAVVALLDAASPFDAIAGPAGAALELGTDLVLWPIVAEVVVNAAEHAIERARAKAGA